MFSQTEFARKLKAFAKRADVSNDDLTYVIFVLACHLNGDWDTIAIEEIMAKYEDRKKRDGR